MTAAAHLQIAAAAGEPVHLPPELARKLLSCANDSEVAGVLGLRLPQRIRMRDAALVEASQALVTDGTTTWQLAQRLAQAIRRFERALLPALQAGQNPPLTPHEGCLWVAYQVRGVRMLRNATKLYSMLVRY